ncbi:uncharacterized protein LOC142532178 isoform X1 [Primulina tabacum]|uniref:uncharacterized protein LOC142532178 isoform X1 n=1 Tax=Primulina tabacum TaxID=48773 RepID=UPI003F5A4309
MVLGLRSKHKRGASVRVQYIVQIQEIRPWPPSESLKSVQTVLIQWENGDQNSGSFISVAGESNIVFNESFVLPITLHQDKKAGDKFKKNYLEFSLFEPRKDKPKGQLLGTASLNLADHGVMDHVLSINVPLSFKKSSSISVQPGLIISFDPVEMDSSNSSPKVGFLEYDDNSSEIASFTDDDASSHSSRAPGSSTIGSLTTSPSHNEKNGYGNAGIDSLKEQNKNLRPPSNDSLFDARNHVNDQVSLSKFSDRSMTSVKNSVPPSIRSSPSSISFREIHTKPNNIATSFVRGSVYPSSHEVIANINYKSSRNTRQYVEDKSFERFSPEAVEADNYRKSSSSQDKELQPEDVLIDYSHGGERLRKDIRCDEQISEGTSHSPGNKLLLLDKLSDDNAKRQVTTRSDTLDPNRKAPLVPPSSSNKPQLKHVKSIQIHGTAKGNGFLADFYSGGKAPDLDIYNVYHKKGKHSSKTEGKEQKSEHFDSKNEWKTRIEMLEEELKEAAAIEVGLYSVVAEHASSGNKVHAPARRLSRFYSNICREGSQAKRSSAARAVVSGLVLVSKSCGNDVPRLTYWLSNSIMLRAIVSQIAAELPHSNVSQIKHDGPESESARRMTNKQLDSSHMDEENTKPIEEFDDFEDVLTFIIALEKVESWLFSRIVESVWWQTFTPHMQPNLAKSSDRTNNSSGMKKSNGRRNNIGNHEQGILAIELWKKAFKDACERLCPIRAGGHECGCLSVLVRLVMEQLVYRLDVAMFNAILRESAEEMPTDPFSDPISDSKVLPIPAGKSSFGAGVQLKNAIGNWSRRLTDLFGIEDESYEDTNILVDGNRPKSFKAFKLLHALSNLMMLPFKMLADASTRKEVCPTFGPTLIKRVLNNFVPDEFCPEPMPRNIVAALDSEDTSDSHEDMVTFFPCIATPTKYSPPAAALLTCVGEVGSQVLQSSRLSTLKKSYASDDELDELDSPLTSIIPDSFLASSALAKLSLMPKEKGGRNVVRYQLLREIWKDVE